jgi:large subunit ribosomal protein L13
VIYLGAKFPEGSTIIDATDLIMGRMASNIAKRLLAGEKIIVINAEKAVLSGKKRSRLREFQEFLGKTSVTNPKYGPHHPKKPDTLIRRVIRGMLPMDKPKGKSALKSLRVFVNVPQELQGRHCQTIPDASAKRLRCPYITLGAIMHEIGYREVK